MEVFISWSGDRSRGLAEALRNWLPKIINALKPWLSAADIDKGARWGADIASKLEACKVGIICLTPSNLHADWILFEAGALSKTLKNTFVCTFLLGLDPADVQGPLAQFQATRATKDELKKLLVTINAALADNSLGDPHLNEAFEVWWPKLEVQIAELPPDDGEVKTKRPEREILEEILALVRSNAREGKGTLDLGEPTRSPAKTDYLRDLVGRYRKGRVLVNDAGHVDPSFVDLMIQKAIARAPQFGPFTIREVSEAVFFVEAQIRDAQIRAQGKTAGTDHS